MKKIMITGGAGFIGVNASRRFAEHGWRVTVLDNLSRRGAESNLEWLRGLGEFDFIRADVRDNAKIDAAVKTIRPDVVLHLAAQVAVTTSVTNPREDFEINALGTFNLLDAVRRLSPETFFIYASTNKVYGKMESVGVVEHNGRYEYENLAGGVSENETLDFHSPYGCSKGVADQYTIDFSRIYDLRTVTFRQSCIYGPRQFGIEDQGWVAWFVIATVLEKPITIYGDGKQIRDLLHVDDLVHAYRLAAEHSQDISGEAFNLGGGPSNTMSLLELVDMLKKEIGTTATAPRFSDWRPGDQSVFVCDITKAKRLYGWEPRIGVTAGVKSLIQWVRENRSLFDAAA